MKKTYLKPCCKSIIVKGTGIICTSGPKAGLNVTGPWNSDDEEEW